MYHHISSNFYCPNTLECGSALKHGQSPEVTSSMKNDLYHLSHSDSSSTLIIWSLSDFSLLLCFCVLSHPLPIHMFKCPVASGQHCFFAIIHHLILMTFPPHLLKWPLSFERKDVVETSYSGIRNSESFIFCMLTSRKKEDFLMRFQECIDLKGTEINN